MQIYVWTHTNVYTNSSNNAYKQSIQTWSEITRCVFVRTDRGQRSACVSPDVHVQLLGNHIVHLTTPRVDAINQETPIYIYIYIYIYSYIHTNPSNTRNSRAWANRACSPAGRWVALSLLGHLLAIWAVWLLIWHFLSSILFRHCLTAKLLTFCVPSPFAL